MDEPVRRVGLLLWVWRGTRSEPMEIKTTIRRSRNNTMSICEKCGQDHAAVHRCQGSAWGKLPKDPAKQSKAANARWTKWRHDRALAYHKRQEQEQFPTATPPPLPEPPPEPETKKTWRW